MGGGLERVWVLATCNLDTIEEESLYGLGGRQVVSQTHIQPVTRLRAEVIEDGLDLAQRHLVLQLGEGGVPS